MANYNRPLWLFVSLLAALTASIWLSVYANSAKISNVGGVEPALLTNLLTMPEDKAAQVTEQRVQALVAQQPSELALGMRTKTSGCVVRGALPDVDCSPGSVFVVASTSTICVAGYTQTVRSVSTTLKKRVYAEYGINYPQPTGSYEADHIIPLELGGDNTIANLFPEAAKPVPGFKEKDIVEDYLHDEVCAGKLPLVQAQEQIAQNWLAVYQALDTSIINAIKKRYRSWAN